MARDSNIQVDFDLMPFTREINAAVNKQIPFATATAINSVAFDIRAAMVKQMDDDFIVRRPFIKKQLNVEKATKTDPRAVIGHLQKFMLEQSATGVVTPRKDSHRQKTISIPVAARTSPSRALNANRLPHKLLQKKGYFVQKFKGDQVGIFFRQNKKVSSKRLYKTATGKLKKRRITRRDPIKLMYAFTKTVKLKKKFPWDETARDVANKMWAKRAAEALDRALKTAKPKGRKK